MISLAAMRVLNNPIMRHRQAAPVFPKKQAPNVHPAVARMATRMLLGLPNVAPVPAPPGTSLGNYPPPPNNPQMEIRHVASESGITRGAARFTRSLTPASQPLAEHPPIQQPRPPMPGRHPQIKERSSASGVTSGRPAFEARTPSILQPARPLGFAAQISNPAPRETAPQIKRVASDSGVSRGMPAFKAGVPSLLSHHTPPAQRPDVNRVHNYEAPYRAPVPAYERDFIAPSIYQIPAYGGVGAKGNIQANNKP